MFTGLKLSFLFSSQARFARKILTRLVGRVTGSTRWKYPWTPSHHSLSNVYTRAITHTRCDFVSSHVAPTFILRVLAVRKCDLGYWWERSHLAGVNSSPRDPFAKNGRTPRRISSWRRVRSVRKRAKPTHHTFLDVVMIGNSILMTFCRDLWGKSLYINWPKWRPLSVRYPLFQGRMQLKQSIEC